MTTWETQNIKSISNIEQGIPRYGITIEELIEIQVGMTISPEEVEFERRQKITK